MKAVLIGTVLFTIPLAVLYCGFVEQRLVGRRQRQSPSRCR